MKLEHGFAVPVPVARAWDVLLDLPTVAPCMPGASLTSYQGDEFTGTVKVKVGPINLTYKGQGRIVEQDPAARRAVIEASGRESRGAGTAKATVTAVLRPEGDATRVDVTTDLAVTGKPAQFGRGMLADVGGKLIGQFAECLSRKLSEGGPATEPTAVGEPAASGAGAAGPAEAGPTTQPVSGEPVAAEPVAAESVGAAGAAKASRAGGVTGAADVPATPEQERDVEPIDLLQVTGAGELTRHVVKYAVAFVAGVLLGWLLSRCGAD